MDRIVTTEHPTTEDLAHLKARLVADNSNTIPFEMTRPVAAFVHDAAGDLVGGVSGYTYLRWLFVERLWVASEARGAGLGSRLLGAVEADARDRGCIAVWLDTFSFQAKPFYERHGYIEFGSLDDFPPGFQRHFLWKSL